MAKKEKEVNTVKRHFFKDTKAELKKVIWPTPKQLLNNTVAVIVFALIIAVIVFVLDLCFDAINKYGVTQLQQKIVSSYNSNNENTTAEGEGETSTTETSEGEATDVTVDATTEETEKEDSSSEKNETKSE